MQAVVDKHSGEGGTLCYGIPTGQVARGFEMRAELAPSARPVHIRQGQLSPKEEAASSKSDENFVARAWIEPSQMPWNSAILVEPKPNRLEMCRCQACHQGDTERCQQNPIDSRHR